MWQKKEANALMATARTPEDHLKLAQYYQEQAAAYVNTIRPKTTSRWPTSIATIA
jgi:hypothetical protein